MKYLFIIISIFIFYACGECNLVEADFPCRVREATITEFNPRLQEVDSVFVPVPRYSVSTFSFPQDNASSGTLTNDTRFDQGNELDQYVIIASEDYESTGGQELKVVLVDIYPSNSLMVGDIMMTGNDSLVGMNRAALRFYGKVAKFPDQFESENAYTFCREYLPEYREEDEEFNNIASRGVDWGRTLDNAVSSQYSIDNIRVLDEDGDDVTGQYLNNIPQNIIDKLLNSENSNAVNIIVQPGDVYYYKARNGKEFAVVITDIRQGTFEPNLNRVTIRFSEIRGAKQEECPG